MHIDFYIPQLQLGIEVQGAQHYYTHPYTRNPNCNPHKLLAQTQKADQIKKVLCSLHGIAIVDVHCRHRRHKEPVQSIQNFIQDVIEKTYMKDLT